MVAVRAPGGVGLLRSSREGGPREDEDLFGETGFSGSCSFNIVFPLLYVEEIRSFTFL